MKHARNVGVLLPLTGAAAILAGLYVAGPSFALLRLRRAMRDGNTRALSRLVDFPALRRGIAHQVAAAAVGAPRHNQALAPFGFSFVSGIARHAMDTALTPATLIRIGQGGPVRAHWHLAGIRVDGPTEVRLWVRAPDEGTMRLSLRMEGGFWRLTGARLPKQMLLRAGASALP